jgi:cytochrome c oxidase subunit IV
MRNQGGSKYLFAWLALLVLTLLSFGGHYLPLGRFATAVALAIAAVKGGIVLVVFMHLTREPASVRTVAVLNIAWVVLISAGIAVDVATQ